MFKLDGCRLASDEVIFILLFNLSYSHIYFTRLTQILGCPENRQ